VVLRLNAPDENAEAMARAAADVCGVPLTISCASAETHAAFAARMGQPAGSAEFLRTLEPPPDEVLRAAYAAGINWIDAPLSPDGRLELTRWLREQAVSETMHRYGNVTHPER
jgi:RHH-type proline utilization regulon transcriptional repressor/proline dehydrogenase/delta 1-pyrroline-5-carboxylate dehydrogenase